MPELPDITVYLEAIEKRILGRRLERLQLLSPFLLRTAEPPIEALTGKRVLELRRLGKRIVLGFEEGLWLSIHLMIAGRLHWMEPAPVLVTQRREEAKDAEEKGLHWVEPGPDPVKPAPQRGAREPRRTARGKANQQARFEFENGVLVLTEAGTKRRASLHLVQGVTAVKALDPGGLEVMDCTVDLFSRTLTSQNHTLKRALTDPRLFSGIGNAYSDEILHNARLSPVMLTQKLSVEEIERLYRSTQNTLKEWIERLRLEAGGAFPENVTAFRSEMAVHGKFGRPCPVCGATVQRIRYAQNETNYCPGCQTGGRLLADRSLSLLLKKDWPRTPEELEELRGEGRSPLKGKSGHSGVH